MCECVLVCGGWSQVPESLERHRWGFSPRILEEVEVQKRRFKVVWQNLWSFDGARWSSSAFGGKFSPERNRKWKEKSFQVSCFSVVKRKKVVGQ